MELNYIILSEVDKTQKNTHGMHSLIEAKRTQDIIHRLSEAQEKGRLKCRYFLKGESKYLW